MRQAWPVVLALALWGCDPDEKGTPAPTAKETSAAATTAGTATATATASALEQAEPKAYAKTEEDALGTRPEASSAAGKRCRLGLQPSRGAFDASAGSGDACTS